MPTNYRQKQNDIRIDERKFEAYYAYVQAYKEWKLAHKAYGINSIQEREAFAYVMKCQKLYNRRAKL